MRKHILQLDFPDTYNEGIFLINDTSLYDGWVNGVPTGSATALPISCGNLQITSPGYITATTLAVSPGFNLILNACGLGVSTSANCVTSCPILTDGMYNIRYSVSPNDSVYVEYKIMRITQALNRYHDALCKLNITPCLPSKELTYQLSQLDIIYDYLITAKALVEKKHQFTDGMNIYRFAIKLLDKMTFEPNKC